MTRIRRALEAKESEVEKLNVIRRNINKATKKTGKQPNIILFLPLISSSGEFPFASGSHTLYAVKISPPLKIGPE